LHIDQSIRPSTHSFDLKHAKDAIGPAVADPALVAETIAGPLPLADGQVIPRDTPADHPKHATKVGCRFSQLPAEHLCE
jgi:hypothetical protein